MQRNGVGESWGGLPLLNGGGQDKPYGEGEGVSYAGVWGNEFQYKVFKVREVAACSRRTGASVHRSRT